MQYFEKKNAYTDTQAHTHICYISTDVDECQYFKKTKWKNKQKTNKKKKNKIKIKIKKQQVKL